MVEELKKEYLDRMKDDLKDDFDRYIESFNEKESHGLIVNLKKLAVSGLNLQDIVDIFKLEMLYKNDYFAYAVFDKEYLEHKNIFVGKHPFHHAGLYYIQEPSAAKPIQCFGVKEDDVILDMCASPGGKTIDCLCNLNKEKGGYVISNEIDFKRAKILLSNIERMGFDNVIITCNNVSDLSDKYTECFDKIIVDAPCSGEGMMRKSLDARLQWSQQLVSRMATIQKELLDYAYNMLKPGGSILYSTCTFAKEEDEDNIDYIINKYKDLQIITTEKLYPHKIKGEGQFYAILKKNGNSDYKMNFPKATSLNNINVLKYGIEKYEKKHDLMMPTHASTHVDDIIFDNNIDINYDDAMKYLHGDTITVSKEYKNGFYKVTYKKLGLGLAKIVNGILKNHYPKGIRNM